jgi:hypothetical protein
MMIASKRRVMLLSSCRSALGGDIGSFNDSVGAHGR